MDNLLCRAWNKKEKRMYPVMSINMVAKNVTVDTIAISDDYKRLIPDLEYKYPSEVLLLWYIGRNDVSNKKIFQGDVVKWKVSMDEYIENSTDCIRNDYVTGVVEWDDEECAFKITQLTEGMFIYKCFSFTSENYTNFYDEEGQARFDWDKVEIIGNRYDDPNLLKDREEDKKGEKDNGKKPKRKGD